jgi:mRNA interferase RelE/StbE
MTYKLDDSIRSQFKKKLAERLINPRIPKARISGGADLYKIKLAASAKKTLERNG